MRRTLLVLLAVLAASGCSPLARVALPGGTAAAAPATRVALYGDSLAWEARSHFTGALAGNSSVTVRTATMGGTALCDWVPHVLAEAERTDLVVISVSGNAFTPCMRPDGWDPDDDEVVRRYLADAESLMVALASSGTRVLWTGSPAMGQGRDRPRRLADGFAALAQRHPNASYVDTGDSVAPGGIYTATLPCLPEEGTAQGCTDGRIRVRADDTSHFCPGDGPADGGVVDGCQGWSSGAVRYGRALADAALRNI